MRYTPPPFDGTLHLLTGRYRVRAHPRKSDKPVTMLFTALERIPLAPPADIPKGGQGRAPIDCITKDKT